MCNPTDYCKDLVEDSVFCHDENCWMPVFGCAALDRAAALLPDDTFIVRVTYVDFAEEVTLRCFSTAAEATDFMEHYKGSGDYLHCYHNDSICYSSDLWFAPTPIPVSIPITSYVDPYDEDIPF